MKLIFLGLVMTQISGSAVVFDDGAMCWRTSAKAFACNFLEVRGYE